MNEEAKMSKAKSKKRDRADLVVEAETQEEVEEENLKRRAIRNGQNDLMEQILADKSKLDDDSTKFQDCRTEQNKLFKDVGQPREGKMDGSLSRELADSLVRRSTKLDDLSRRIHFDDFAVCLTKSYKADGEFCWRSLGQDVGKLFLRPTPLVTMLGSMDQPEKVKNAAKKKDPREKLQEVRPEELIQDAKKDGDGDEADDLGEATFARITAQDKKLIELSSRNTINVLKVLVDERDPVQTVENFFDLAFLIKDNKVSITEDTDSNQPMARHAQYLEKAMTKESRQLVLSLNMKDLKRLASALKTQGNECPIHREDELYQAADVKEQTKILAERVDEKLKKTELVKAERRTQKSQTQRK